MQYKAADALALDTKLAAGEDGAFWNEVRSFCPHEHIKTRENVAAPCSFIFIILKIVNVTVAAGKGNCRPAERAHVA
jgi:hypothetical protein